MDEEAPSSPPPRWYGLEVTPENVEELVRRFTRSLATDAFILSCIGFTVMLILTTGQDVLELDLCAPTLYRMGLPLSAKVLQEELADQCASWLPLLMLSYWIMAYGWSPLPLQPDVADAVAGSFIHDLVLVLSIPWWSCRPKTGCVAGVMAASINCRLWCGRPSWRFIEKTAPQWSIAVVYCLAMVAIRCYCRRRIHREIDRVSGLAGHRSFTSLVPDDNTSNNASHDSLALPHVPLAEDGMYDSKRTHEQCNSSSCGVSIAKWTATATTACSTQSLQPRTQRPEASGRTKMAWLSPAENGKEPGVYTPRDEDDT